jgi:hypothetical protein
MVFEFPRNDPEQVGRLRRRDDLIGNFHFALSATGQYTPIRLRSRSFCIGSKAKAPVVRDTALAGTKKAVICPIPQRFLGHFSLNFPPSSRLVSPGCRAYPAGSGKASIRRSMPSNRRQASEGEDADAEKHPGAFLRTGE